VIGISILSGAHLTLFPELLNELAVAGAADIVVFGGGIIPEADIPILKSAGVAEIFTPGTTTQSVVDWVNEHVSVRR
jgi:methylmalonyl-CoA mutase C-terminal domain/subunit